jgi:hypothetical protein
MAGSTDSKAAHQKEEEERVTRIAARDAALSRAQEAEKEAAAAAKDREDTDARARAALQHATRERKATADAIDDANNHHAEASVHGDLHGALLLHEAAALLNLHAQAIAVQNIRSLVLVVLDINSGSYSKWHE